jgi:hypothetical protein
MRFLKFVILVVLVYANLDIVSQWTTEKSYTNVGSFSNLNIEYKVNKQYNNSVISCIGEADGEIAVIISGGTPPYSVIWGGDSLPVLPLITLFHLTRLEIYLEEVIEYSSKMEQVAIHFLK